MIYSFVDGVCNTGLSITDMFRFGG